MNEIDNQQQKQLDLNSHQQKQMEKSSSSSSSSSSSNFNFNSNPNSNSIDSNSNQSIIQPISPKNSVNLILNHHPNINNLLENSTKIPSFPSINSNLNSIHQSQLDQSNHSQSTTKTLRIVNHSDHPSDISIFNLPYPNPDLSLNNLSPNQNQNSFINRKISPLPNCNQDLSSNQNQNPIINVNSPIQSNSNHLISILNSKNIIQNPQKSNQINSILNELENRTNNLTNHPTYHPTQSSIHQNLTVNQPNQIDRFSNSHQKQFNKSDSIINHYAAKRKINSNLKEPCQINPSKRLKVQDSNQAPLSDHQSNPIDNQINSTKRQLELAKARRKTLNNRSSFQTTNKVNLPKPTPSGFSSFGTRLFKSAVKTVKGAFKSNSQDSKISTNGVGFGVPAGLGIGPAKVPQSPIKKVLPIRTTTINSSNRLPPAGHRKLHPNNLLNHQRVISGPASSLIHSNLTHSHTLRPRPTGLTSLATASKIQPPTIKPSTWQPKTLNNKPSINPTSNPLTRRNKLKLIQSKPISDTKIPKITTHGQRVIRPTISKQRVISSSSTLTNSSATSKPKLLSIQKSGSLKPIPQSKLQITKPISKSNLISNNNKKTLIGKRKSSIAQKNRKISLGINKVTKIIKLGPENKKTLIGQKRRSSLGVGINRTSHRVGKFQI